MIKIKLFRLNLFSIILLSFVSGLVNSAPSIYEDAEDDNIDGWLISNGAPPESIISNIYDTDKNSRVIALTGDSSRKGYQLGNHAGKPNSWDNRTQTIISWEMKYAEAYTIYISVQTSKGHRYILYTPSELSSRLSNYYIHHGLNNNYTDGEWHKVSRDLQEDLHAFEADNSIISVNSFLIRGRGRLDNISLSSKTKSISETDAAKFLTQATFGPTENTINQLVSLNNLEAWIDNQITLPISRTLPYVLSHSNGSLRSTRHYIWWQNVMQGEDQLRQRVAFALSEIFVISDLDYTLGNSQYGISHYYDMLAENAFGNYRELLEKVTLHPTMGIYLSMVRNQKANAALNIRPDENYAREILQLFSIGLYQLNQGGEALPLDNPRATYSQDTIENFARVFTGWNFSDSPGLWVSNDLTTYDKMLNMVADYDPPQPDSFHDTGTKKLLDGTQLLANLNSATPAEDDLQFALDNIANHQNVGPFISKLLIQRLTTSNPSPEYVERVANKFNDNGQGERGDLLAVIKAILLDNEARGGRSVNADFGKIKEPLLQLTQLWRAFEAKPGTISTQGTYRLYAKPVDYLDEIFGQAVLKSPSVFNFFLPNNPLSSAPDSVLVSPEMQIMTEANIAAIHNAFYDQIYIYNNQDSRGWGAVARINIDKAVQLAPQPDIFLDYLDKLLLAGDMTNKMRLVIKKHIINLPENDNTNLNRALDAIFIIVASPSFMIQQ